MVKKLSFFQTLKFMMLFLIPSYTQGLFTRSRFWVSLWSRLNVDRSAVRFGLRLRSRLGTRLSTTIRKTPTVILLDPDEIKDVLANSPRLYVDAESKHVGMSHFQPDALTISRGEEWKDRRRFNEGVLNTGHGMHAYADRFLETAIHATSALRRTEDRLKWDNFDALFENIASGVIFGIDPAAGRPIFELLNKLMRESNSVSGARKSRYFDPFYAELSTQLRAPRDRSLAALCLQIPHSDVTRVVNQLPHWMFAIRETLPVNTIRTLALIASHPGIEMRVRDELMCVEKLSAEGVDRLTYLGACVQETMRLWPTTPIIARQTVDTAEQILILNTFNHRDSDTSTTANAFYPDQWLAGIPDRPFNHFSSGTQICPGRDLALFLAKAVLASLLRRDRYVLKKPRINPAKPIPFMYNYFRADFQRVL